MYLPTEPEIRLLHQKYAPTPAVFELVFSHCQIVRAIADQLITSQKLVVDQPLVGIGCLLHDVGVYSLFDKNGNERADRAYITHGINGEAILKQAGFPELIWRFASHHTGVGLSRQDVLRQGLPLPAQDYLAETTEERLIMYADKFHTKMKPLTFNSYDWYKNYVAQFGPDNVQAFQAMADQFGVPVLDELAQQYGQTIR